MRPSRLRIKALVSVVVALAAGLLVVVGAQPALALVAQPHTTASHYISNATSTALNSLGASDGTDIGTRAGTYIYVIDFGQVQGVGGAGAFGGYAMADFDQANNYPLISFATIRQLVDGYIQNWYSHAGSSPHAIVAVGTSNDRQCALHTSTCTPSGFGSQLAFLIYCIQQDSQAYASQVAVAAADDIEGGYDDANRTIPLVQSYNASTYQHVMYDYGDVCACTGWTDAQYQYVAYGAPLARTIAEAYYQSQDDRWATVDAEYGITFDGIMTQYPAGGASPATAWGNFQNTLYAHGVGQSTLYYGTNI